MGAKAYRKQQTGPARQAGFGTLIFALVILTALTLVVFYAAQTGLTRQRITANEIRTREALEAAEAGVERAMTYLDANRTYVASSDVGGWVHTGNVHWLGCGGSLPTTLPCSTIKDLQTQGALPPAHPSGISFSPPANHWLGSSVADYVVYTSAGGTAPAMLPGTNAAGPVSKPKSMFTSPANGDAPAEVYLAALCADTDENNVCDGVAPKVGLGSAFLVVSTGYSADQSGEATVQQGIDLTPQVASPPDAPLVASSSINLGGNIELVTNPNGGGPGVPLSAWSNQSVTIGSNAVTCQLGEFLESGTPTLDPNSGVYTCPASGGGSCSCSHANATGQLSYKDNHTVGGATGATQNGGDILGNATPFPPDLFAYVFGYSRTQYTLIKNKAQVVPDCTGLGPSSTGIIWVTGTCRVATGATVGSIANPVIVVAEDREMRLNSNTTVFGLLFAFDANNDGAGATIDINGTAEVYGAILAEGVNLTNGTLVLRYEKKVLMNLSQSAGGARVARIPGTWRDM